MCGLELEMSEKKQQSSQEVTCHFCKLPFREPFSGRCNHPACKSCWAVHLTKNLQDLEKVRCEICGEKIELRDVKPDQNAQRRLQKYKNTRCKNCPWKGSYTEYIAKHERVCGDIIRIQCKVLGCEKWLPKDKALELHRSDDWCPMILLMKTRLSHAEIVHLSMRESWDWTVGLVLRSEKESVRNYIERLVLVFSVLDPTIPIALENDEYGATAQGDSCDSRGVDSSNDISSMDSDQFLNDKESTSSPNEDARPSENHIDGHSSVSLSRKSSAQVLPSDDSLLDLTSLGQSGLPNCLEKEKVMSALDKEMKQVTHRMSKVEKDVVNTKRDLEQSRKQLEPLKNMPKAFAALNEKMFVTEGVMATFNNEVITMNKRMDNFQVPNMLADTGILEKLVKANQDINRSITSLAQSLQKLDGRLLDVEASHSGVFLWKIANYSQKKREAQTTNIKSIYSPPFFTSQYGYKLCGRVFLMGDGVGKGTHISLFLTIMKGPYDAVLPWPFKEKITFQLVNQEDPVNKSITEAFRPDPASSSFKRPTSERNIGAGCPLFAKIQMIEEPKQGFVRDDTLYLKIISNTSDLPEVK